METFEEEFAQSNQIKVKQFVPPQTTFKASQQPSDLPKSLPVTTFNSVGALPGVRQPI